MEHNLPPEVWRLVFDVADPGALLAASTTSRFFHASSIDALIRRIVWRGRERALQHLSALWTRFPHKGRHVRSLTLYCTPPLHGMANDNEIHRDILKKITLFRLGLTHLTLSGVVLHGEFFGLLDTLARLRELNLRQCVVPPPPATLCTPPPLQHLSLVHLDAQVGAEHVYSPYFIHLFPNIPMLSFDRTLFFGEPIPHAERASPTRLTIAGVGDHHNSEMYTHILAHTNISLRKLTHLRVLVSMDNFPPYYEHMPVTVPIPSGELDSLHSLMAPLNMILRLAAACTGLVRVTVQGPLCGTYLAFRLVDRLVQHNHPVAELAFTLVTWDGSIFPYICEHFPDLESLEVLFLEGEVTPEFLAVLGKHIAALPRLRSLYLHNFPDGWYDCFPWRRIPKPTLKRTIKSSTIDELSRFSSSLMLTKLDTATWVRADVHSEWLTSKDEMGGEWSSSRSLDEHMRLDYDPRLYIRPCYY
ncbi:hypothetical protein MKEN_01220600 [Mycena kentingensis (nom. inval.)]|nr:hypothetical protein MKEN_01220600 [Mycena kentingensis (nom. inval.)]